MSTATPKAKLREVFTDLITTLRGAAENIYKGLKGDGQRKWPDYRRNAWDGSISDLEGFTKAFDRSDIGQDAKNAVKDPEQAGVVGDFILCQLQGDYVACFERAYRARNSSSIRAKIHAAARRNGHSHERGVLQAGIVNYLENISKLASQVNE